MKEGIYFLDCSKENNYGIIFELSYENKKAVLKTAAFDMIVKDPLVVMEFLYNDKSVDSYIGEI